MKFRRVPCLEQHALTRLQAVGDKLPGPDLIGIVNLDYPGEPAHEFERHLVDAWRIFDKVVEPVNMGSRMGTNSLRRCLKELKTATWQRIG